MKRHDGGWSWRTYGDNERENRSDKRKRRVVVPNRGPYLKTQRHGRKSGLRPAILTYVALKPGPRAASADHARSSWPLLWHACTRRTRQIGTQNQQAASHRFKRDGGTLYHYGVWDRGGRTCLRSTPGAHLAFRAGRCTPLTCEVDFALSLKEKG